MALGEGGVPAVAANGAIAAEDESPVRRTVRQFRENRVAVASLVILVLIVVLSVLAPWIAPQDPYDLGEIDIADSRLPPGTAKMSPPAELGLYATIAADGSLSTRRVDRADYESLDQLRVEVAAQAEGGGYRLALVPTADGPLDPLRGVQVKELPGGATLSAGEKDPFRNLWRVPGSAADALVLTLPAATARDEVTFRIEVTGERTTALQTFWLGTDDQGRDMLSAILYGLRISIAIALGSVLIALTIGTLVGLCAAYYGGRVDAVIMRVVDLQLSFPTILVALILLAAMGQGLVNVLVALVVVQWALYARTARGVALAEREREYVEAARGLGLRTPRILLVHILPNCLPSLIVIATLEVGNAISLEATLSFLGLGLPVTEPSLGLLVSAGFEYLLSGYPWISILPGVALLVTVVCINLVGDELRDIMNPRLQK